VPAVAVAFALAPLLLLLGRALASGLPDFAVDGDMAVTELAVREAAAGQRRLGPYSRFAFNHPGPLPYYLLVPGYRLAGESFSGLLVSALVLNLVCAAALLALVWRTAGRAAATWAGAGLAAYLLYLRPELLHSVWNPNLSLLPFALAVVAAAAAASGRSLAAPVAVAAGSLALQCHVAYLVPSAAVAAVALAWWWRRRSSWGGVRAASSGWRWVGVAALLGLLLWAPVLAEEVAGRPGNLTRLARFFAVAGNGRSLPAAADVTVRAAGAVLLAPLGAHAAEPMAAPAWPARVAGAALVVALAAAGVGWRRDGERFTGALAAACLAVLAAAVVAVTRIVGPLEPYLLRWITVAGALGLVTVLLAFARPRPRTSRAATAWAGLATAAALAAAGLARAASFPPLPVQAASPRFARIGGFTEVAATGLARHGVTRPRVGAFTHRVWDTAAGVALGLAKRGFDVGIDPAWQHVMGRGTSAAGAAADGGVILCGPEAVERLAAATGERLGGDAHVALLAVAMPASVREIGMGEPLSAVVCREGFYGPEEGRYRWSQGRHSTLALPLLGGLGYELEVVAAPAGAPGRQQRLAVWLNGVEVAVLTMSPGPATYRLDLPARAVTPASELRFAYAYTIVPGARDPRELAVRFERLRLTPATPGGGGAAPGAPVPGVGD